jgi:hypothetical protein
MLMKLIVLALLTSLSSGALAQGNIFLRTGHYDYQLTKTHSDLSFFSVNVEFAAPLVPGVYNNPDAVTISLWVRGNLAPGTPSGFADFDHPWGFSGTEFYNRGGSLRFEISNAAVLSDGIQVSELVGDGVVLTVDSREIDYGSYHPAIFELRADGTGRIQNSNNIVTLDPLNEVDFGEEYITDLRFDPGNTTVMTDVRVSDIDTRRTGSGSIYALDLLAMLTLMLFYRAKRKKNRANNE